MIHLSGNPHRVDRDFHVHTALQLATALAIIKFFGGFGDDGIAVGFSQSISGRIDQNS